MTPGDKVVCVNDGPCRHCGTRPKIILGQVYVVSWIGRSNRNRPIVELLGLPNPNCHPTWGGKVWHGAVRFRKLDELKQEARERQEKKQTA